jgi:hypothetical protein
MTLPAVDTDVPFGVLAIFVHLVVRSADMGARRLHRDAGSATS